ncbi:MULTISPECIES: TspO/MBR family protein [unclassified Mesorhizobium]|uniref:TspO/MBR family protein n=1 Tax=unclassified Mesorhizobium TaxID=325217 RepID=UPI0003CFA2A8|nr:MULTISPECIES: TspO/MBR family protein [unclassified Mesorhizobium]ESZ19611.1 TspO [Mesorhizobium sp. L48C026A00]RWN51893.1 MAG: tryptophan-rich sensory protein [Mesorhizobium sp.]RWN52200.1 MAG: tryptophan-rich sensory protein [Mesorhizobium sp.]RWN73097.1 MAG: tryptophan-rich sensory protein [Mesorhizobium sp.]RWN76280.1 MAG: tryptophan-rich sensory protein [Mesorhizobium sp.]
MINPGTSTLLLILAAIVPVAAAAIAGNLATIPNVPTWYAHLIKPSFNPPNWVFAPVWTTLYLMMAYAFYRVLKANADWISFAVAIFLIQITLNAAWSWVFFSFHSPRGGLVVITLLWLAIVLTILAFWQIDPTASMLLWPYLLWVSFAAALNWEIDRLN